jgi:Fe-S cluster assembly ATPase SufC
VSEPDCAGAPDQKLGFLSLEGGTIVEQSDAHGYQMMQSFEIANFRCFEKISLTGFRRINVVTGSNGSGKSALLEAVYLGANATAGAIQNIAVLRSLRVAAIALGMPFIQPFPIQAQNLNIFFDHLFRSTKERTP